MLPNQLISQEHSPRIEITGSARLPVVEFSLDQEASRTASWEIFQWVTANGEGVSRYTRTSGCMTRLSAKHLAHLKVTSLIVLMDGPGQALPRVLRVMGDKAVSPKTTLGRASSPRKFSIDSWINVIPKIAYTLGSFYSYSL